MINNTVLTGRLVQDPELKYTGSGVAVISFRLAVNRNFTNANGEREADFINCQAWRGTAEVIANNLNKGSLIGVEGRIQTRNYQDNDNKTVYITEVVVDSVTFLESKTQTQNNNNYQSSNAQSNNTNNNSFVDNDPFESKTDATDISDDDLPF